jgi:hypothetical protein
LKRKNQMVRLVTYSHQAKRDVEAFLRVLAIAVIPRFEPLKQAPGGVLSDAMRGPRVIIEA